MIVGAVCKAFPTRRGPHKGAFFLRDLAELGARGHQVRLGVTVSRMGGPVLTSVLDPGVALWVGRHWSFSEVAPFRTPMALLAQWSSTRSLLALLDRVAEGADVLYAKFLVAGPVLSGAPPGVFRVLGVGEGSGSLAYRFARMTRRELARLPDQADVVEVKNEEVADLLASRGWPIDRIRIVPSGVDTTFFAPGDRAKARRELGLSDDAFVVASVGVRGENKGGDRVRTACRHLDDAGVVPVLVGEGWPDGPQPGYLGVGPTDAAGVRRVLHAADVFVFPSLSEGMPNAVLEALACGLPCIVSDRPFMAFLSDRESLKVDPTSETALASAIATLRGDAAERAALAVAARRVAERFSLARRAQQLEAMFREGQR